jgi:uncharacterized protein YdeI (YjbR/CyaY-like superfamily)
MPTSKVLKEPVRLFRNQNDWAAWLEKNHPTHAGLWLRIAKKDSGAQSVSYAEALEVALCYGWIDGQKRADNEQTWLQRFVPRAPNSIWSKINCEKALGLIKSGRMKAAGLQAIEQAKSSGRWQSAYDSPSKASVPEDFAAALPNSSKAKAFFAKLDRTNRYAILFRIHHAKKAETRARKIREFVEMLKRGEKIHGPRRKRSAK